MHNCQLCAPIECLAPYHLDGWIDLDTNLILWNIITPLPGVNEIVLSFIPILALVAITASIVRGVGEPLAMGAGGGQVAV